MDYEYLTGKAKWYRSHAADMKFGDVPKWKHVLYLDQASVEKFRELQLEGVKNHLKKDDDGYFVTIGRPTYIKRQDGSKITLDPPSTFDYAGMPMHNTMVGNGSDVTTKIEVYSHKVPGTQKRAKAIRWLSTKVHNLVPFSEKNDFNEEQQRMSEGLSDRPEPLFQAHYDLQASVKCQSNLYWIESQH